MTSRGAPSTKRFVCATHGHCFDGLASAVLLQSLAEETHPGHDFQIFACGYGHRQDKPSREMLSGAGNAIVDFRYEPIDSLTHYYDHHRTAFAGPEVRQHFEARANSDPSHFVFNPDESSCAKLIAQALTAVHGKSLGHLESLVEWADRIDAARFSSAEEATDKSEPVLRLAAVVEQFGDRPFLTRAAEVLARSDLETLCKKRFVTHAYELLEPRQDEFVARVRARGTQIGRVAFADLGDQAASSITKFVQYRLWPTAAYSVMLTQTSSGIRIAIGHNPWSGSELDVDISRICARYGGGGHPMVGGIGFSKEELDRARQVAEDIVTELQTPTSEAEPQP